MDQIHLDPRTTYPPPLGHIVNKTPSPHRTKKRLQPPPRIILEQPLVMAWYGTVALNHTELERCLSHVCVAWYLKTVSLLMLCVILLHKNVTP